MVAFGIDISHHQDLALDLARCKREGVSFVFLKATEGSSFVDDEFQSNLGEARAAGLLVAAYHYVKSNASAAAQVAHIARVVPKSVPIIPDTEAGGGPLSLTRDLVTKLRAAGYRVPLLYLPRWYWQQIGSPSMTGLPPLWSSRYPDNVVGSLQDEWADVPASYWSGYGGLDVAVLQFTSSAAIAGHQPLDANAYRGTPAQLAALLGGSPEEDDMEPTDLLDFKIARQGSTLGGETSLRALIANFDKGLERDTARDTALAAAVAALSKDPELDTAAIAAIVDAAVRAHTPTAEQIAGASQAFIAEAVQEALGGDNEDLAKDIVRRFGEKLGAA